MNESDKDHRKIKPLENCNIIHKLTRILIEITQSFQLR